MARGLASVFFKRRFWPLFVSQFLGAGNDNLFKNAIAILVIYRLAGASPLAPAVLVNLAAGLFILPFFLFSATAGQLADRFEKSGLIRAVKFAEIVIAGLGAWALLAQSIPGMLAVLFLLGVQAAFFGPLKYAILPEQLEADELVDGNALVEGGTFLAILLGTIAGGLLILLPQGIAAVSALLVGLAALGFAASLLLPRARPGNPAVAIQPNFLKDTAQVLGLIRTRRDILLSVLGISWFWLVGATYLAQFPAFAKDVLHGDEHLVTLMLTLFSVGIGLGSMLCTRLLKGEISARHVPAAALLMGLFALDLWFTGQGLASSHADVLILPLAELLQQFAVWRVLADLLLLAVAGGVYIVPLYTLLQARSEPGKRARVIAANNIVNAAFMVVSALAGAGLLALGCTVPQVFLAVAVATLLVAVLICGLLPDTLLKTVFAWTLRLLYRVEVRGLEHLAAAGPKAVIVVNHVSFLDAALMAVFLPGKPTFAVHSLIARLWWVRPFLSLVDAYLMDPANPVALKGMIHAVQGGRTCVIFPEGRITTTGSLMKIYAGPGLIADKADAAIVPVRIDGAQYTPFSRLGGKVRRRLFPRIRITMLPPQRFTLPPEIKGRARRQLLGLKLYDAMSHMMFETSRHRRTLFAALLDAARTFGAGAPTFEDINRRPLSYGRLIAGALVLGRRFARDTRPGEALGLLLPSTNAAVVSFFAAQAFGRVPAMLNFSTGPRNVLAACETACIRTVITSRRFIEQARLEALAAALETTVRLVYLEDLRGQMTLGDRLYGLLARPFAARITRRSARRTGRTPDDPAVILFTSGTEGAPKAVVLSHENILTNCRQLSARVAFSATDLVFNALPIFHSFGLTGGVLLPVFAGLKTFLYPSPLHYRIVPELIYDTGATIMFGTDTFLAGYGRVASPYDFHSVRLVFAGAEKLREQTRHTWMDRFGLRILEGYGTTETSPALAVNTPMHCKPGTVGRLLPGIEHRLEPVPGINVAGDGGRLWVKGASVMLGYFRAEQPGVLQPPAGGWYDTGDIVAIDELGYVRILDRAKRFAKIAGEMISLGRVESEIAALWPRHHHAVIARPDESRGEQLVLFTDNAQAARPAILAHFRSQGLAELMLPRVVHILDRLPTLATGKADYVALKALLETMGEDASGSQARDASGGQGA